MVATQHTEKEILNALGRAYFETYEEKPPVKITPETKIYSDLRANEPDSAYALEWRNLTARHLGIDETALPKPEHGRDYKISELVEMIRQAEAA